MLRLKSRPPNRRRAQPEDLYKAETIVTGTGEAERMRGFRIGAEDVLVKLTGDASLRRRQKRQHVAEQAAALVAEHQL